MSFKWSTLGELSIGGGKYGISAPAVEFDRNLPAYLRITDINDDGSLNLSGRKSVADPLAFDYMLQEGDIVFARTGSSTGRNYYYDLRDGDFAFAGFLIKFSLDKEKVNPRFIKYYVQSKPYWDWVSSFNTGSTRGNINAKTYAQMPVPLPDRDVQDAIVCLCDSLSNKIRINNRLNDYLAELLNALFVDMLNDADASWERLSLLDIASYKNGLAMQKFRPAPGDPGLPVLKIKELGQGVCTPDSERCASTIDESVKIHDGNLVFSWSGTLLLDFWAGGDAGLNQHLFKVTSDRYPSWLYYLWTKHHMDRFIMLAKDRATTMGHIKRSALAESEVLIPPVEQLEVLTRRMQPIVDELVVNKIQSRNLADLRDVLLPKLMSGGIDISNVRLSMPPNNHLPEHRPATSELFPPSQGERRPRWKR